MTITAKVIEDSVGADNGVRLTTVELTYPRFVHSELMTHRVFSRNASSSRAIPILKMLGRIWNDMAMPVHWGKNQKGMQANEQLSGLRLWYVQKLWKLSGYIACGFAYLMYLAGLHKQVANRITEPWSHITVVVTATEWSNFFELRDHPDAQPEIRELAQKIAVAMANSDTVTRYSNNFKSPQNWHLPYISNKERETFSITDLLRMSTARCARTSYLTHDKKNPDVITDIQLHDRLVASKPIHASPTEHQAFPAKTQNFFANFRGWKQYRKQVELKIASENK